MSEISASFSASPNISMLIAYLHDIGKSSYAFQDYIKKGGERGSIIHSWQGALLTKKLFEDECMQSTLLKEIIGFCVTAHHNRLRDGVALDGRTNYFDKFIDYNNKKYFLNEIETKITLNRRKELQNLFDSSSKEMFMILSKIKGIYKYEKSAHFALGLYVKYLYSCLVDADRLDAYLFEIDERYSAKQVDWNPLIKEFEANISKFSNKTKIDEIRKLVSDKCKNAAKKETGIYQLSVPTGGGKTLSSFRFALHHCEKTQKRRIIYVIPYLSIIEQTAKSLNNILNLPEENEIIFEHHSNILDTEDEQESETRKLSAARWDSPIVITTMVQFLESVMSSKGSKLRKFAAMANSVIIFDEVQSMPIKAIHCFNEIVTFMSKMLNSTIILCSATQPTLELTQRKNLLLHNNPLLIDCVFNFKDIRRVVLEVESEKDISSASDFIYEKSITNGDCLVIVNTKKSAFEIYNNLKTRNTDFEIIHLSTSMCSHHRIERIERLKNLLKSKKKVICVATQLIEAGVDISFSCVIRAMAGLDSIAQAAGRCNRNGESHMPKTVYTFPLKDENLDKLIDIKSGKTITAQIASCETEGLDLLDESSLKRFYRRFFAVEEDKMDYIIKECGVSYSIYSMLSDNKPGKDNYYNRTGNRFPHLLAQAFHTADINFNLIDKNTKDVVVIFGESEKLLEEYKMIPPDIFTKRKSVILKKLQKYSVSLYKWQLSKLMDENALYTLGTDTGIMVLSKNYYSTETGVVLEAIQENLIV